MKHKYPNLDGSPATPVSESAPGGGGVPIIIRPQVTMIEYRERTPPPAPYQFVGPQEAPPGYQEFTENGKKYLRLVEIDTTSPADLLPRDGLPNWSTNYMFDGQVVTSRNGTLIRRPLPTTERFSLWLLATLSRMAYGDLPDIRWMVGAMLPDVTYARYTNPADAGAYFDVWRLDSSHAIVTIRGTTDLTTWLGYAAADMVADSRLPTSDWKIYKGVLAQINRFHDHALSVLSPLVLSGVSIVLTGHSVGGAIAQYLGYELQKVWYAAHAGDDSRSLRGVYTFGCPAYLKPGPLGGLLGADELHARSYDPSDGVPSAAQMFANVAQQAASAGQFLTGVNFTAQGLPSHVIGSDVPVQGLRGNYLTELNRSFYRIFSTTTPTGFTQRLAAAHSMASYCANLEQLCRVRGDTPLGYAARLVRINQELKAQGY